VPKCKVVPMPLAWDSALVVVSVDEEGGSMELLHQCHPLFGQYGCSLLGSLLRENGPIPSNA
jgi:hypothetical protein